MEKPNEVVVKLTDREFERLGEYAKKKDLTNSQMMVYCLRFFDLSNNEPITLPSKLRDFGLKET